MDKDTEWHITTPLGTEVITSESLTRAVQKALEAESRWKFQPLTELDLERIVYVGPYVERKVTTPWGPIIRFLPYSQVPRKSGGGKWQGLMK